MTKLRIFFLACFVMPFANAQNITDAVRYSQQEITGTARYRGVGGAFGALGGDLSAINDNPAGSAIFNDSQATITISSLNYDNQTYYNDGITSTDDSDLDFNQLGGVFVLNTSSPNVPKISLGFNYDRTANFDNAYVATGSSNNSIDNYFLDYSDGVPLELLQLQNGESITSLYQYLGEFESFGAQQAFLGYQSFVIDPVSEDPNNTSYTSNISPGNFNQEYNYISTGYNSKASFNVAAQFNENLYLGINLNSHFFDFEKNTLLFEDNNNPNSEITYVEFENNLRALGSGFSFQIGGIYHLTPNWRVGATYNTPTWYTIEEETTQSLFTDGTNGTQNINPNVTNIYEDYDLQTPGKVTGSVAYVFGGLGFISFDYSYQDYSNVDFGPQSDPFFTNQNTILNTELTSVSTYKMGGEYRFRDWSFRAGYRFEESPYTDTSNLGNLNGYSLGLGYTFGSTRIDVAYDRASQERNSQFYQDTTFTNSAFIDEVRSSFVATLSFSL